MRIRSFSLIGALLLCHSEVACARSPELRLTADTGAPAAITGVQKLNDYAHFYRPAAPANAKRPLLLLLHGAGMPAHDFLNGSRPEADRCGCLLLAVQSAGITWDTIGFVLRASRSGRVVTDRLFGADTGRIEQALSIALRATDADRRSVMLVGFSDGASIALTLGLANPTVFSGIIAIAPGFHLEPALINPQQRLFIAHSPADRVLPFKRTRDETVASLKRAGYDLSFRPFEGGHQVDMSIFAEAVDFVLSRKGGPQAGDGR